MFAPKVCENPRCPRKGMPFRPRVPKQRYCSNLCRYDHHRAMVPKPHRKRLRCKWCRGRHLTDQCPNRGRELRKLYGTVNERREYVPPPGVSVRVIQAPYAMHGDELTAYLSEGKEQR